MRFLFLQASPRLPVGSSPPGTPSRPCLCSGRLPNTPKTWWATTSTAAWSEPRSGSPATTSPSETPGGNRHRRPDVLSKHRVDREEKKSANLFPCTRLMYLSREIKTSYVWNVTHTCWFTLHGRKHTTFWSPPKHLSDQVHGKTTKAIFGKTPSAECIVLLKKLNIYWFLSINILIQIPSPSKRPDIFYSFITEKQNSVSLFAPQVRCSPMLHQCVTWLRPGMLQGVAGSSEISCKHAAVSHFPFK